MERLIWFFSFFEGNLDQKSCSWLPEDWLATVKDATEDTLLDIAVRLPSEAADAILAAATGERPQPPQPLERGQDPWSHPDALRRFRVVEDVEELKAALDAPWEKWAVFLHPAQREFVERDFNGPARVIGSAGTGKTVVALHRAVRLAGNPEARVLLTTFNRRLALSLQAKLPLIASGEVLGRITVEPLGSLISSAHSTLANDVEVADETTLRHMLEEAAAEQSLALDPDFLFDEWTLIVDAWDIQDGETYKDLPRLGRKVRMPSARRVELWRVFEAVRQKLGAAQLTTESQLAHGIRKSGGLPFDHIVVDEAQDISVAELLLLGSQAGDRPNGLFFAGDIGQRIFRAPFPWSAAGVSLRGRSRNLKVNYRTSHQIRSRSDLLLPEVLVEADGSENSRTGVTSVFDGPKPVLSKFETRGEELEALRAWLNTLKSEGVNETDIAVLVRRDDMISEIKEGLSSFSTTVMSMHDAKGAEFRGVAVVALDDGILPDEHRVLAASDEAQLDEVMSTERHLLYVAATRARDHLWMSGVTPVSEFFEDLVAADI